MLWMANTTELLSFVQEKVLEMEKEADQEGELGPSPSKPTALPWTRGPGLLSASLWLSRSPPRPSPDPQLCNDLELCDEAMALLDEVIMCTFQQSVYYLTKVGLDLCFLSASRNLPLTASHRSDVTSDWPSRDFLLL